MGYFVSKPVPWGERMPIEEAREHIFGFVLLNDWSARDHQLFEMRPLVSTHFPPVQFRQDKTSFFLCFLEKRSPHSLTASLRPPQGPFHSKGFGTSISNWIVPLDALLPFSCAPNTPQDPPPFPHLSWPTPGNAALDIKLKVTLVRSGEEFPLGSSNLKYMYWTPYQQLAHHAASGCGMLTGDLLGTGTISGAGRDERGVKRELGCLYEVEMTGSGVMPMVADGEGKGYQSGYLEDGDEIILEGWCEDGDANAVLGFGECRGRIAPPK